MTSIDPDLLPQGLPAGWVPGAGKSLGAMVVGLRPGSGAWGSDHFGPTEWRLLTDSLEVDDVGDIYFTSLIKTRAEGDTESQLAAALPYAEDEIQRTVPRFVLALGQETFTALTGLTLGLDLYRGIWHRLADRFDWEEGLVLGTYSPEHVLANPSTALAFMRDARVFAEAWKARLG